MATLVLSTVGTALGGPVGGAIGSLIGQSIDQQLFGPGPRRGPRLGDLAVQSSAYGSPIPKLFGSMRVAGTIVWSTELKEQTQTQTAKGEPGTITYSYSVSFAVALSSRPIARLGRIWADGKLIRGADDVFSVATDFRVHEGLEDQALDPLIASIEGVESTPCYRGVALAVFENLELAEFGNRIPFLTFEVIADEGPIRIGAVLAQASEGAISSAAAETIRGYAAYGPSVAGAVQPLVDLFGIPLFDDGKLLASPADPPLALQVPDGGCSADERTAPSIERSQSPAGSLPSQLSLSYYDPVRDYQAGLARASLDVRSGTAQQAELAAAMDAADSKALAETCLARRWARREKVVLRLPPSCSHLRPGMLVEASALAGVWRAERVTLDSMVVTVDLRPLYGAIGSLPADEGRLLPSPDISLVPTQIEIIELPDDATGSGNGPAIAVAAAGGSAWRAVPLHVEVAGAEMTVNSARRAAIMGSALTTLAAGQSAMFDLTSTLEVRLRDPDDWLESRDDDALCAGANVAVIGDEIIQFATALPLGDGVFRLSRLLRGRRGTEWAMSSHVAGERFTILEARRLTMLPIDRSAVGAELRVTAGGLGDADASPVERVVIGEAMKPPSAVHLRAVFGEDRTLKCSWVRRSHSGWAWLDQVEAPLGCAVEAYRVTLSGGASSVSVESAAAAVQFTTQQLAAIGSGEAELAVQQVGDFALSRPALLTINIL